MAKKCKWLISILLVTVIMCAAPVMAAPSVMLDGNQLSFDVPPIIEDGRTLVPLRAIFEAMGATVTWDQANYCATAVKDNTTIVLRVGSTTPIINGQTKQLDVPAKVINGRTLAPLRFVGEAFGGTVQWNPNSQLITIATGSRLIKVHFIDVGQADSIYIQLSNNNDILIDGGNEANGSTVVNYLKNQGMDNDIELLIATHPHEDHIGGLLAVLNAFKVNEIIDSGEPATTNIYKEYVTAAKAEGCTWISNNYQTFTWGSDTFQILTGNGTWQDLNDYSVVTRLDCGDIEFLFDGDAETPAETALQGDISADILKVGHHGSSSSTSPSFLSRVKPQIAVISVGTGNTYGHPTVETLTKLQNVGAKIYRTDLNGNVDVTTDGKTYSITTQKNLSLPAIPVVTPVNPSLQAGIYVGSINSNKYHLPSCTYAKQIYPENQIWFSSKAEAEVAGYVPCKVCKP